jgi:polysaccharide deacetylase family protein (PEP-CTERM system associated)
MMGGIANSFTIDIEDWFNASVFHPYIKRENWSDAELRIDRNVDQLLEMMAESGVRATCFILGWIAEQAPGIVRRIAEAGHEIASHGYAHELVYEQSREQFCEELLRSVEILRQQCGQPVIGYRAASFSLPRGERDWAYQALAEKGIKYDSSIFPIRRRLYGQPDAAWDPFDVDTPNGKVREFPLPVVSIAGQAFPYGGGGYFRLYPYSLTRRLIRHANNHGRAVTMYIHPWEIDATQPRMSVDALSRFRHYNNIRKVPDRLKKLWSEFEFVPLQERLNDA